MVFNVYRFMIVLIAGLVFITLYLFVYFKSLGVDILFSPHIPFYLNPVFLGFVILGCWLVFFMDFNNIDIFEGKELK